VLPRARAEFDRESGRSLKNIDVITKGFLMIFDDFGEEMAVGAARFWPATGDRQIGLEFGIWNHLESIHKNQPSRFWIAVFTLSFFWNKKMLKDAGNGECLGDEGSLWSQEKQAPFSP
jgi:hypothetical protein